MAAALAALKANQKFRIIGIDIEHSGSVPTNIGIAYYDGEVGSYINSKTNVCRFNLHDRQLPFDQEGNCIYNPDGSIRKYASILGYGDFTPDCVDEFWNKLPDNVRGELLFPPGSVCNDASTWNEFYITVMAWCMEAVLHDRRPVIVSDNPAFDIGECNKYLDQYCIDASLFRIPQKRDKDKVASLLYGNLTYSSIRQPNTAKKLRDRGILVYSDITIEGVSHTHMPEQDALCTALDYASFVTAYGLED